MTSGTSPYRVLTTDEDVLSVIQECNRVFGLLSDRLDKMEGYRGKPEFRNIVLMNHDVVVTGIGKGIVLRDNGNPASYWRVTIDSTGTLQYTNIGRDYE